MVGNKNSLWARLSNRSPLFLAIKNYTLLNNGNKSDLISVIFVFQIVIYLTNLPIVATLPSAGAVNNDEAVYMIRLYPIAYSVDESGYYRRTLMY